MEVWDLVQVNSSIYNRNQWNSFTKPKLYAECQEELLAEQQTHSQITSAVLAIFFISLLGVGVGQTAVSTLGIPYIDDNVASRESPIYIGKMN